MKIKIIAMVFLIAVLTLTGCQTDSAPVDTEPAQQPQGAPETQPEEMGYPIVEPQAQVDQTGAYPIESTGSEALDIEQGPEFNITLPVKGGDNVVTGTGPADVPINLIDVTEVGSLLGETIIDSEGNFRFELENPLISGHTIGIQLGDISNTDFDPQDFLYSPTYYDRPQVGILFDMVNVE